jgi:hypothetical protein
LQQPWNYLRFQTLYPGACTCKVTLTEFSIAVQARHLEEDGRFY